MKTETLIKHAKSIGAAATDQLARFVQANIYALKDVVVKERIPCEFELRRSYDAFTSESGAQEMEASFRACLERGDEWSKDRDWIGPEFAERLTSVKGAKGAVSVPCCSFWPYKFVTVLLERAMAKNGKLNIQTETPVLKLENVSGGPTAVHTKRGVVKAKKIVLATNAYTAALLSEYRGVITPYKGTAAHLAASNGRDPVYPHLSHTYNLEFGLDPELETVDYLNPRPDGGIVVGGGKWIYEKRRELWYDMVDDSTLIDPVMDAGYFDGYMQRNFKGWEDSGTEAKQVWTGSTYPRVGPVPSTTKP